MSRPRYTCAESTLTISTGNSAARRNASSLLPVPVGPVRTGIGRPGSAATQEHSIELVQAHLRPRRASVIALIGARGLLHLAQQRVHLRQRKPAMRMYGRAARDGA